MHEAMAWWRDLIDRINPSARRSAGAGDLDAWLAVITPTLDAVGSNVFVAGPDLQVVFANRKAKVTLATIAPDIERAFGVKLADMLCGPIQRFHRDPARVERILQEDGFTLPHQA